MPRRANEVDRYVASRMRTLRISKGMTQQQLADLLGVTYQQVNKRETGINLITVGQLVETAEALGVPVLALLPNDLHEVMLNDRSTMALDHMMCFHALPHEEKVTINKLIRSMLSKSAGSERKEGGQER